MPSLEVSAAWARLGGADHGVLGTLHPERGVDLVPVVFVVGSDRSVFVPVDRVKAKSSTRLRRIENLRHDPRCSLLAEHYEEDWTRLWWVRLSARGREATRVEVDSFRGQLTDLHRHYAAADAVVGGIVLDATAIVGWRAG